MFMQDADKAVRTGLNEKQYRALVISGWVTTALASVGAYVVGKNVGRTAMKLVRK